jgi:hypothetical protein
VTEGVVPYAGETVKLQIERGIGGRLDVDDAGLMESVLPGWTPTSDNALATGRERERHLRDAWWRRHGDVPPLQLVLHSDHRPAVHR